MGNMVSVLLKYIGELLKINWPCEDILKFASFADGKEIICLPEQTLATWFTLSISPSYCLKAPMIKLILFYSCSVSFPTYFSEVQTPVGQSHT